MKKLAGFVLAVVVLLAQAAAASAQISDYEVIETFKKKQQSLLESVKTAQTVEQCIGLESEIGALEAAYAQHRKLLAEGLYPATFDVAIGTLREQLKRSTERVSLAEESKRDKATIEVISAKAKEDGLKIEQISRQNEEYRASIEKLSEEVKSLSDRIQRLSGENQGLVEKIKALQAENKQDKESIAKLKALNEKLAANLRDRDELVMKMMDSLFGEYAKAGLTDAQQKNMFVNVQGYDYVGRIITTLDENVKYAESALFSAQDLKTIRDEQKKLADKWGQIKPYVARLYPDEQSRVRDIASVDSRVSDWKMRIDETTWKSLYQVFTAQKVDIGSFSNAGEFHARVLAYIDRQMADPSRDAYRTFKEKIWDSPIKDQWLPALSPEELTPQQRGEIEARIVLWEKKIAAIFWRFALIGILVAALIIAVFAVVWKRKHRAKPKAEDAATA